MENQRIWLVLLILFFSILIVYISSEKATGESQNNDDKPDLIITDIWRINGLVYYQIRNIGESNASLEHKTALLVDGEYTASDLITQKLASGERLERCFNYEWKCTMQNDTIKVCADYDDNLEESNETNNCREEIWKSDTIPPKIVFGPNVVKVGKNNATIYWETDEDSNSFVKFGKKSTIFENQKSSAKLTKEHSIVLNDLKPSSIYHYIVQSTDASGNCVFSKERFFETKPKEDSSPPIISSFNITKGKGAFEYYKIQASVFDNVEVDRVEFYLDNKLIGIDYSAFSPYQFPIIPSNFAKTREKFFTSHKITVKAYDRFGNSALISKEFNPPNEGKEIEIRIISPNPESIVYTPKETLPSNANLYIEVYASEVEWMEWWTPNGTSGITGSFSLPENVGIIETVERVEFYIDGNRKNITYPASDTDFIHVCYSDVGGLTPGTHTIMVVAYSHDGGNRCKFTNFVVEKKEPSINIERVVKRYNNYFDIFLFISNLGDGVAFMDTITENLFGFQAVRKSEEYYDVTTRSTSRVCTVIIDIFSYESNTRRLGPDETFVLHYCAVPIMYGDSNSYHIGYGPTYLYYDDWGGNSLLKSFLIPCVTVDGKLLDNAVEEAISECDYLIVTNPFNLFALNNDDDVFALLAGMAELAYLKNGVLGYTYSPSIVYTIFDKNDGFACGDVDNDGLDEIIVAEDGGDMKGEIHIYTPKGWKATFKTTFDKNDGFACGDVDGDDYDEIFIAEDSSGYIFYYGYYLSSNGSVDYIYENCIITDFSKGDGLVCGDVDADGIDEVIVAEVDGERKGMVDFYNSIEKEYSVLTSFDKNDGFSCGDVDGDGYDEIIVAEDSGGCIYVYNTFGLENYIYTNFDKKDGLGCGDVDGDGIDEILVGKNSGDWEGWVYIYSLAGYEGRTYIGFDRGFDSGDVLNGDGTYEIITAVKGGPAKGQCAILSWPIVHRGDDLRLSATLIGQGGLWSSRMRSDWASNGYLLIVGETEIIGAGSTKHWKRWHGTYYVHCSDWCYAQTAGNWIDPELIVGRIIGNNARELLIPIQTSINVYKELPNYEFDRSDALLYSGWPESRGGGSDHINFESESNAIKERLLEKGTSVFQMDARDYLTRNDTRDAFFSYAPNKDIIHLSGHGDVNVCDDILITDFWGRANPFGNTKPFVFASSCLTGKYYAGTSLAEIFLRYGAGVYIGSTEISYCCANKNAVKKFYEKWTKGKSIGQALKETKIELAGFYEDIWTTEYHLYGDPKYGEGIYPPGSHPLASAKEEEMPKSSIYVVVPDFEVENIDGKDYVEIPGGNLLFIPGKPLVPFYAVSINYLKGYRVQNVNLTNMSGLTATNLNIPDFFPKKVGSKEFEEMQIETEWWPEEIFNWSVKENIDGTSTLIIRIYPFFYNSLTTNVKFYKNFYFNISYITSNIEIEALTTNKNDYSQGENVLIDLWLNNSGNPRDVIVNIIIKAESSNEIVDGLLLRSLKNLKGLVSFSTKWNTTNFESGYYYVEVEIKDKEGNVLDMKMRKFRLGISSGKITNLTTTPKYFDIGENIKIKMIFKNTGKEKITGTAIIKVLNQSKCLIKEFFHNFTDLIPSENISFSNIWNTSGTEKGYYKIVGYVLYDDKVTFLYSTIITTDKLPKPSFTYYPENPVVNQEIIFNASSSYDPSKIIISYDWEFGDGNTSHGEVVKHSYSHEGNYIIKLILTDLYGSTSITTRKITVFWKYEITIKINDITDEIKPKSKLNISGSVDIYPQIEIQSIKLYLDNIYSSDAIFKNGSFFGAVLLPVDLKEGEHIIIVNVTLVSGDSKTEELIFKYKIEEIPKEIKLEIIEIKTPDNITEGDVVLISVILKNSGDVELENIKVKFFVDGKEIGTNQTFLKVGQSTFVAVSWTAEIGEHTIKVEVIYQDKKEEKTKNVIVSEKEVKKEKEKFPMIFATILIIAIILIVIWYLVARKPKVKEEREEKGEEEGKIEEGEKGEKEIILSH